MDTLEVSFLVGVDGTEFVALEMVTLSRGRRLRSRRRRCGKDGHELAGETHSLPRDSGMGNTSEVRALCRALSVTST